MKMWLLILSKILVWHYIRFINQTSSSIERSKDNRFNDSLYNIINRIEDNYRATTLDNDLLPTKIES